MKKERNEQQKKETTERYFTCDVCMVDYKITVEPMHSHSEVIDQYPESVKWLAKVDACPYCGKEVEET